MNMNIRNLSTPALQRRYAYLRRLSRRMVEAQTAEPDRWRVEDMIDTVTHELGRRDKPLKVGDV